METAVLMTSPEAHFFAAELICFFFSLVWFEINTDGVCASMVKCDVLFTDANDFV